MVKAVRGLRSTAARYLERRGLERPAVQWAAIKDLTAKGRRRGLSGRQAVCTEADEERHLVHRCLREAGEMTPTARTRSFGLAVPPLNQGRRSTRAAAQPGPPSTRAAAQPGRPSSPAQPIPCPGMPDVVGMPRVPSATAVPSMPAVLGRTRRAGVTRLRRHVQRGIAVEEAERLEPERHRVHRHDRPVLRPGDVVEPEHVPEHHVGVDQRLVVGDPLRSARGRPRSGWDRRPQGHFSSSCWRVTHSVWPITGARRYCGVVGSIITGKAAPGTSL